MTVDFEEKILENKLLNNTWLDKLITIVAIVSPLMTIPQIYQIFTSQSAAGVSLATWSAYFFMALVWVLYGIKQKDKAIIINNTLWAFFELFVIVGVIVFR